ncbi:MAG TPA: TIR domain-containing protein [Steroidobacteraceae bacterium]|nr:TIR domain-containing protein [Steroidobacteraceae bacterium]
MTEPPNAVFLSYASQDAEAARRICEALRAAGIEVWFDQSELRGGDAWDTSIRRQIKSCALFVPVISHNTHDRDEGYFRLEWKLAVDRSHPMTGNRAFLLPVVIDDTRDDDEQVPDRFREVQWTRLPEGETPPAFVERVRRLLSGEPAQKPTPSAAAGVRSPAAPTMRRPASTSWRSKTALLAAVAVTLAVLGYVAATRLAPPKRGAEAGAASAPAAQSPPTSGAASATGFNPPPHSIAVLPFVNLSGDKEQEYFSDGLTEELLNSLAEINELQVAARTSAFSFKGQDTDIGTIARKLNVGAVLEGSVRRSSHTIRITAQLINAVTGFHLWSKTYDRDLGDVLKLQTEIATSVASALKVTLLADVAAKVELGGTVNPAAFDAYLRAAKAQSSSRDSKDLPAAIAAYTEAIRLDPHYALAFAGRSSAFSGIASDAGAVASIREGYDKAQADAQEALRIVPDLAQGHVALANVAENGTLDFTKASEEYERALALAPGNAMVLRNSGAFAAFMGHFDAGIAAARRAVVLDPLARQSHGALGQALYAARRYEEAAGAFTEGISVAPDFKESYGDRGFAYYGLGDLERARAACEVKPDYWASQQCLAVIYDKLGKHAEAQAELEKLKASQGDGAAYQYATIQAQWGNRAKALEWLETAWRLRDPGLEILKTDPLMDPLRKEPRFQAIERALRFPD